MNAKSDMNKLGMHYVRIDYQLIPEGDVNSAGAVQSSISP